MKRSPLLAIFLIVLVDVFGLTLVIPLLAIYAEHLGATPLQATLLVSTYALFQLVSGPLLGVLSDRVGRKPLLLVSQLGTLIGFLLMARAESLSVLYLARVIDGATAGNISLAQAYISDNTETKDRARSFALIGIAFGLGFFVGPAITGRLVAYGLNAPIYLAAALSFTSIVCTATLLSSGKPPQRRERAPRSWRHFTRGELGALLFQFLCFALAFSSFTAGFALFTERRITWNGHPFGPREIGYVFAYAGLLGMILQGPLFGRIVQRFGEANIVRIGFVSMTIGYGGLAFTSSVPVLLVMVTFAAIGNSVLRPALTSLVTQTAGRDEQGAVLGVTQSITSAAMIVAPALAGFVIGKQQLTAWACIAGGIAAFGVLAQRWHASRTPA